MIFLLFGSEFYLSIVTMGILLLGAVFARFLKLRYSLVPVQFSCYLILIALFFSFLIGLNIFPVFFTAGSFVLDQGLMFDRLSIFFKLTIIFFTALITILFLIYVQSNLKIGFEIPIVLVYAAVAMLLLVSSSNFLTAYLAIELQSLSFYVLASSSRFSFFSTEAGLKYFILGGFASGILLFGISIVYIYSGSLDFLHLYPLFSVLSAYDSKAAPIFVGLVFILSSILFKLSAFPFHSWTPDVYHGSPIPITAAFSVLPKLAVLTFLFRIYIFLFTYYNFEWSILLSFVGILSICVGAFGAIYQTNLKRLLAYSTISHMGFIILGFSNGSLDGFQASFFYLLVYVFISFSIFLVFINLPSVTKFSLLHLELNAQLRNLLSTSPSVSVILGLLFLSLAGVPPLAGFFGKYLILVSLFNAHSYVLAVIAVLVSVVSAFYYLRLVKFIFFVRPSSWGYRRSISFIFSYLLSFISIANAFFLLFFQFFIFTIYYAITI